MTTVAAEVHGEDKPDPNEVIRVTVRALRSAHQVDALELAQQLGVSRQSIYNRLNGHAPWLASEVAALADFFGCDVQDLYDGTVRIGRPLMNRTTATPPDGRGVATPVTGRVTRTSYGLGRAAVIRFPQVGQLPDPGFGEDAA